MTAAFVEATSVGGPEPQHDPPPEKRRLTAYWLLFPGALWLLVFFVVPFYSLVATSLYDPDGSVLQGYEMTWAFGNYVDAIQEYWRPLLRSLWYGGVATAICLVLGYVLAYAIAFKSGRWKNLMLVLVIAPFFISFLLRTLAWKQILSDEGPVVGVLQAVGLMGAQDHITGTGFAVVFGLTYNFIPFMTLPIFASLEKIFW